MTTITHICTGYLISRYAYSLGLISPDMFPTITTVSILAANGPDFDVIFSTLKKNLNHRESPLHTPFYWFITLIITYIISLITNNAMLATYIFIIGINVLIHFFMDSVAIGYGIRWLGPFIQKEYGIIFGKPSKTVRDFMKDFFRYPIVVAEISFWIATVLVFRGIWHV